MRVGHGLAQRLVVERRLGRVELVAEAASDGTSSSTRFGFGLDRATSRGCDVVDHVDLAADQALELDRVVWDRPVADAVEVRAAVLVPVAVEALRRQVIVLDPLDELEGPGPDRVALESGPNFLTASGEMHHAGPVGQGGEQRGVRAA